MAWILRKLQRANYGLMGSWKIGDKMTINSRQKGAAGEREWAKFTKKTWRAMFARRGCQFAGGPESPDVIGIPGLHCEVKRCEKLSAYKAMSQAVKDSGNNTPYVAHRRNCEEWLIIIRAEDVLAFVKAINEL